MSEGRKMPLVEASKLAEALRSALEPGCERIAIAGSVRRRKPMIGDIEICAIPRFQEDLFGGAAGSILDAILERLVAEKRLERIKGGDRYKQYLVVRAGCKLDIFCATPENFGCVLMIRTGPAPFSHRLVTPKGVRTSAGEGILPQGYRFAEGRLWCGDEAISTPDEDAIWRVLGIEAIAPEDRE